MSTSRSGIENDRVSGNNCKMWLSCRSALKNQSSIKVLWLRQAGITYENPGLCFQTVLMNCRRLGLCLRAAGWVCARERNRRVHLGIVGRNVKWPHRAQSRKPQWGMWSGCCVTGLWTWLWTWILLNQRINWYKWETVIKRSLIWYSITIVFTNFQMHWAIIAYIFRKMLTLLTFTGFWRQYLTKLLDYTDFPLCAVPPINKHIRKLTK